ncbi:helix-turn-helix domain-containing protein [Tessaracoccus sp.]
MSQPPLNEQIRSARTSAGLSVSEVARRARTSRAAVHAYETGEVSPSLETAQRVLAASGCTLTVQPAAEVAKTATRNVK